MASTPLRGPRSFLVIRRLAFHPVLEGRIDVECLEDAQARIGGAPQKAIVLGKRERFGTKQDALHLSVLGCPQDSVGVREQLSRRLAAQLDGCVGETRVAVEAPVTREGHDACDTGLVDGVVGLPGRLALHHDQGGRPVHGKAIVPICGTGHVEQPLLVHLRGDFESDPVEAIHDIDAVIGHDLASLFFHAGTPLCESAIRAMRRELTRIFGLRSRIPCRRQRP